MARGVKGSKSSSSSSSSSRGPASSASVERWQGAEDIPMDDQEQFHHNRDKILLDGTDDDDGDQVLYGDQREVLGLNVSESEDESDSDDGDEDDEDEGLPDGDDQLRRPRQYKRLEKEKAAKAAAALSDDEDVELTDEDSEDDISRWGSNKKAYYNTNDLADADTDSEIDEEEARKLELAEVKKLQAKSRAGFQDSDFGLGEADELGGAEEGGKGVKDRERRRAELDGEPNLKSKSATLAAQDAAPSAAQELPTDPVARAAMLVELQKTSPETVALAGEYADAVDQLIRIRSAITQLEQTKPRHEGLGMIHLHFQTLYTYVTTLTFYFHLRSTPKYSQQPALLSQHPVLDRLLKLKESLSTMEQLHFSIPLEEEDDDDLADQSEISDGLESVTDGDLSSSRDMIMGHDDDDEDFAQLGDLDEDELAQLVADAAKENVGPSKRKKAPKAEKAEKVKAVKEKKSKKQSSKAKATAEDQKDQEPEKEFAPLASLASLDDDDEDTLSRSLANSKKRSSSLGQSNGDGDFGESTSLTSSELADKAAKKRSLRFYTGQLDAADARRGAAARDRMGGDSDLPYRDRERSRMAVEQAKSARVGRGKKGGESSALDGEEWGEGDAKDWRDVMGSASSSSSTNGVGAATGVQPEDDEADDDYYDLVTSSRQASKRAKKDEYDSSQLSSRLPPPETEDLTPGEHRSLNRQIERNKGLKASRGAKQDRNLRVKKRKKYEAAQKKLSSTRAVYKGGLGALQGGAYQGEQSGINMGVGKSRRFGS